jgi:hypothetical protein
VERVGCSAQDIDHARHHLVAWMHWVHYTEDCERNHPSAQETVKRKKALLAHFLTVGGVHAKKERHATKPMAHERRLSQE